MRPESRAVTVDGRTIVEASRLPLTDLAEPTRGVRMTFADLAAQPRRLLNSPIWTGLMTGGRAYSAYCINVERLVPWRTLTGRQHFFNRAFGSCQPLRAKVGNGRHLCHDNFRFRQLLDIPEQPLLTRIENGDGRSFSTGTPGSCARPTRRCGATRRSRSSPR